MAQVNPQFATREDWLVAAADVLLDGTVMPAALKVNPESKRPTIRITTGFSKYSRGSAKAKVVASCFQRAASTDGVNEVFVNPEIDDPIDVLGNVVHELIHAVDDCASGHKRGGFFARTAIMAGLVGPATATKPGLELSLELTDLIEALGPFPHSRMQLDQVHRKQETRQLKVYCAAGCGFVARTSAKWIGRWEQANPTCPCCASTLTFNGNE